MVIRGQLKSFLCFINTVQSKLVAYELFQYISISNIKIDIIRFLLSTINNLGVNSVNNEINGDVNGVVSDVVSVAVNIYL